MDAGDLDLGRPMDIHGHQLANHDCDLAVIVGIAALVPADLQGTSMDLGLQVFPEVVVDGHGDQLDQGLEQFL